MNIRYYFFSLLLGVSNVVCSPAIADEDNEKQLTETAEEEVIEEKITGEALIIEFENGTEVLPVPEADSFVPTDNKSSIEMIVGGQAKDGLSKQGTLPIKN